MSWHIPVGNYPDNKHLSICEMYPDFFESGRTLESVCRKLGNIKYEHLSRSGEFLYASLYQKNSGAAIVMLLSAVESLYNKNESLLNLLSSNGFKTKFLSCSDVTSAFSFLMHEIEKHNQSGGTRKAIVSFYKDYITFGNKQILVCGLDLAGSYTKISNIGGLEIYDTEQPTPIDIGDDECVNEKLSSIISKFVYDVRNAFVHRATYFKFPTNKLLNDKKYISKTTFSTKGKPMDEWFITLSFERFHEITRQGFIKFWLERLNQRI